MSQTQNVGKKRKKNGYTQIANSLFEDSNLSWRAKGILCYLLSRPDNWKINKSDLQRRASEGRDAVQKGLNELKDHGYLHIYPQRNKNGVIEKWIWEYDDIPFKPTTILETHTMENPQEIGENLLENQTTENPHSGKSSVWNSSAYNNKNFNNKDYNNTKSKEILNNRSISPEIDREFEQLWKIYPRKMGKKKAFDSFKKARKLKKIPYETIENGLYRYIRHLEAQGTDEQYVMHGSTWFNQEKWRDEYTSIGLNKKPKNALEYLRMRDGGERNEHLRNRETIDCYSETIPEPF